MKSDGEKPLDLAVLYFCLPSGNQIDARLLCNVVRACSFQGRNIYMFMPIHDSEVHSQYIEKMMQTQECKRNLSHFAIVPLQSQTFETPFTSGAPTGSETSTH